jgi:hypothetical protein
MRASILGLTIALLVPDLLLPAQALAQSWEVRREIVEGARSVAREKREAGRELRRCTTRECARREVSEGYREVNRERREARREIRSEVREDVRDQYWRNGRYFRDGRHWEREAYMRRYYGTGNGNGYGDNDDGNNLLKGLIVGAAVVGVTAAIINAQDD